MQHIPVVHPVSGLIIGVDWVFVADLFGPVSLLVHVGTANQFGTKVPVLSSRQLNVHGYIVIGFLWVILKQRKGSDNMEIVLTRQGGYTNKIYRQTDQKDLWLKI